MFDDAGVDPRLLLAEHLFRISQYVPDIAFCGFGKLMLHLLDDSSITSSSMSLALVFEKRPALDDAASVLACR